MNEIPEFGVELDLERIDKEYGLIVEDSMAITMTEFDYETMEPMGETFEMVATLSFKMGDEIKKLAIDISHLILLYKKAKNKGIEVKLGEKYNHQVKVGENIMAQNPGFNILDYIKESIKKEKDQTNFMFG
ncbi:MAG: hypothetical protein ACE5J5_07840 [Candidatus Hydrothermarchaeales archaeon]